MKRLLALLILVSIPAFAFAEWTMIQTNDEGNMYIDLDSIQKSGDLVTVLTLNDYYGFQKHDELSSQSKEMHDCKNKKFKALSIHYFSDNMGKGKVIETFDFNESETVWSDVVPYSIGELKVNIICSR